MRQADSETTSAAFAGVPVPATCRECRNSLSAHRPTSPSAYTLIHAFEQVGILREITGNKWGINYRFE